MKNNYLICFLIIFSFLTILISCSENEVKFQRYYADGAQIYKVHCQNCHMSEGEGLQDLIPPLTDSIFLKKNRNNLACIVRYGLEDSIVVKGKVYQSKMPGEKHLQAIDIAKVLTYVTNSFGNKQGIFDVTEAQSQLNNCIKR